MNNLRLIAITKYCFWFLAVALVIFLLWKNYSPLGSQHIDFNLMPNIFVSEINPSARITAPFCEKDSCSQIMFGDPLYFDLLLARKFDLATIKIYYSSDVDIDLRLGMQTREGWNYMIKTPDKIDKLETLATAEFSFPLSQALVNKRRINFIISAPEIRTEDKEITIHKIEFDLKR
ncbi:MAG: hypothetical protein UT91_C0011G0027 [Parcubacteria group bacterium GW2011_GWA2_40_23]|nr:MAG: hypothetical protein UT91_C0011G0027 [Parcubacteria group bacterium GW2011_GWA2_40_23]